ncbi:MAG: peptide deformylase [Candidatus Riflebacteria bacterium]|nr:peptide deformylase [Candidatus Riflebacteria bacterium]
MKYRILHYGEAELRKSCEPIKEITEEIKQLVSDMFETMYEAKGVGLAGPQVGKNIRLAIIDIGDDPIVMINPEIIKKSGKETCLEGCLSFPGLSEKVERALKVTAEYTDLSGDTYEIEAEGLLARAIQHELDHLDGIVFVDRISKARKIQIKNDLEAIKNGETLYEEEYEDEYDEEYDEDLEI